jgi:dihydrofolate synthase/folylpolyglutamate synthase
LQLGCDYQLTLQQDDQFLWRSNECEYRLDNVLNGIHQAQNLAGVVAGLSLLLPLDDFGPQQLRAGFHGTRIAGRLQLLPSPLACRLFADVGHNQDAARVLADSLHRLRQDEGRIVVVLGMLKDKQPDLFVEALKPVVDEWWLVTLDSERGLGSAALATRLGNQVEVKQHFERIDNALDHALSSLTNHDIMLVTGSFVTVELLLRALSDSGYFSDEYN